VKADDLLDQLIASAKKEVDSRHPQLSEPERQEIATQIAIGALRYFMMKFTKQSVIAFDFKEALSFEGETGPYAQYAVVRATSIFRKAGADPETFFQDASRIAPADLAKDLSGRVRQRDLGAVAGVVPDLVHHRQMHRHHGAGLSGETCFPAGATVQRVLPPPSHPERARRKAETVPAGNGGGRPSRIDSVPGGYGHHRTASHVEYLPLGAAGETRIPISFVINMHNVAATSTPSHWLFRRIFFGLTALVLALAVDRNDLREHFRSSRRPL
jgi:hypothetical protein